MSRALAMRQQAEHDLRVASENHKFNTDMAEVMQRADINLANRVSKIKEPAPLDSIIEDKTNKANILSGTISNLIDKEKEINTKIAHINFWRIGFSNAGIKSKILNSITPFLNKQADIYIRDLTDGELTVIFSTQTQLKNGQTKEQFSVEVKNKNGASTYDGSSGGEKARADLAITLTLSDLYASRSKKSYPQRWFDEPFEALDEAGIEAVMDLLANMVSSCGSIFVITHQGAMKSLFNRTISFEKRNGETRLVA
jgi:DNA repair exonuclease SbcCD ATPase subunit